MLTKLVAGAGGASLAAKNAGFLVKWALEMDPMAGNIWKANHTGQLYDMHSKEFLELVRFAAWVAVIHLSPPCQPGSNAHSTPGQNDEPNLDTLMNETIKIIRRARPLYFTFEEATGFMSMPKHLRMKNELFNQFMEEGLTFEWGRVNFSDFGAPTKRE